ncbi:MAG: YtxH domain-containing protein [Chitinophagaceae bacterium]|nr:YtxH domain-containing protein [Chitinophagaceae bacterium]
MNSNSKLLLGILGAAAAGVVIGLLIAPEKGIEMRSRIARKATDLGNSLSSGFNNILSKADDEMEEMKGKARRAKSAAEENLNSIKESFS